MPAGGKDKGTSTYGRQNGMGRLRRSNIKQTGRLSNWERFDEDDEAYEKHGSNGRTSHAGEHLIASFNRLVALRHAAKAKGDPAEVCEVRPGLVMVRFADGREEPAAIRRALEKRMVGVRNTVAVGDRVRVELEAGDRVISAIEPRRNQLARTDAHNRSLEHVLAANVDLLVAVGAVREPDFKHGFIDRALLLASAHGIAAAVVITKRDLGDPAAMTGLYSGIGYPCLAVDARDPADPGISALRDLLAGKSCMFSGQSGVGKSSLVNACFPGTGARVGVVAEQGFGRHTTTMARSFLLPKGVRLIDTPGIRECVVGGLQPTDVALLYPDLAKASPKCHFPDCTHRHEPDCAVLAAVEDGTIAASRYWSYRSIVDA